MAYKRKRKKKIYRGIEFQGRTQLLKKWAKEFGINPIVVHNRLSRGWPFEEALTTPVGSTKKRIRKPPTPVNRVYT